MRVLVQMALVAGGSALGGLARWGVGVAFARWLGTALPFGTFFINISGSLFLGWFSTLLAERWLPGDHAWLGSDDLRLALAVGFTGAYTTFSTFEWETHGLLRDGELWAGMLYSIFSLVFGLVAVRLGVVLARGL
jgi:CrcB protein